MLKTMAVRITKKNYPTAVACLAAGFATIPPEKTFGHYLVINEPCTENFDGEGKRPYLVVGNSWMSEKHFNMTRRFVDETHDPKKLGEIITL